MKHDTAHLLRRLSEDQFPEKSERSEDDEAAWAAKGEAFVRAAKDPDRRWSTIKRCTGLDNEPSTDQNTCGVHSVRPKDTLMNFVLKPKEDGEWGLV